MLSHGMSRQMNELQVTVQKGANQQRPGHFDSAMAVSRC